MRRPLSEREKGKGFERARELRSREKMGERVMEVWRSDRGGGLVPQIGTIAAFAFGHE